MIQLHASACRRKDELILAPRPIVSRHARRVCCKSARQSAQEVSPATTRINGSTCINRRGLLTSIISNDSMTFGLHSVSVSAASCCAAFLTRQNQNAESSATALTPSQGGGDLVVDDSGGAPSATDVSTFVFIHTVLSAILVSSTWYLAYVLSSPARVSTLGRGRLGTAFGKSLSKLIPKSLQSWYHKTTSTLSSKAEAAAQNSKSIQRLQTKYPQLDGVRVATSYVEAKIVRLFFKPITVPGRIWMSWKATKWWKRCLESIRRDNDGNDNFKGIEELTWVEPDRNDKVSCMKA